MCALLGLLQSLFAPLLCGLNATSVCVCPLSSSDLLAGRLSGTDVMVGLVYYLYTAAMARFHAICIPRHSRNCGCAAWMCLCTLHIATDVVDSLVLLLGCSCSHSVPCWNTIFELCSPTLRTVSACIGFCDLAFSSCFRGCVCFHTLYLSILV